jgi:hypothetical protein
MSLQAVLGGQVSLHNDQIRDQVRKVKDIEVHVTKFERCVQVNKDRVNV